MTSVHTGYDWLFNEQSEKMSGDIYISLEHLPPEPKQVALQIKQNLYSIKSPLSYATSSTDVASIFYYVISYSQLIAFPFFGVRIQFYDNPF